jgi:predicted nicotinamide N-methyase
MRGRQTPWIETCLPPPAAAPDAWIVQTYRFGVRELLLARPCDPDRLLDDPAVQKAAQSRDYMPYWAYLWPGALLLAQHILSQPPLPGLRAIEIGCGLGLAGVAALAAGLHVTFSDYSPAALALAAYNARMNRFSQYDTRHIDWQDPPLDQYDIVLGADVLYESRCLGDVLRVLGAVLSPNGEAWLSDPYRSVADEFPLQAQRRSLAVDVLPVFVVTDAGSFNGRIFRVGFQSLGH